MDKICHVCGQRNDINSAFCIACGARLEENKPDERASFFPAYEYAEPEKKKKKHTGLIVALCLGGLVLLAVPVILVTLLLTVLKEPGEPTVSAETSYEVSESSSGSEPEPWIEKPDSAHIPLNFSTLKYERPDFEKLAGMMDSCMEMLEAGQDAETLFAAMDDIIAELNHGLTMYTLADLKGSLDYTDEYYTDEWILLYMELDRADIEFSELIKAVMDSEEYGEKLKEHWGEDYVYACLGAATLNDAAITELSIREQELEDEYDSITKDTAVELFGKTWTMDDLYGDHGLEYDQMLELYDVLSQALCEKAGPLYLELLDVRTQKSDKLGYDSYAEYAYDCHGRDYAPEDVKRVQTAVKAYVAPIFSEIYELSYNTEYSELYFSEYSSEELLPKLYSVAGKISPALAESMRYMLSNDLYDIDMRPEKLQGGFTTAFPAYGNAPFLYDNWTGEWNALTDIVHELGHYNSYYWREDYGWNVPDGTDIAEVDSQGLEMLMCGYYEEFFSGGAADAARVEMVLDCLYTILSGCMEDEFQQTIYEDPDITLHEINALYYELSVEYGLQELYDTSPEEWVLVSHTFKSPLYYISYAAAMVPSAELWMLSTEDHDAAVDIYENIVFRNSYDSFLTVLSAAGLSDPFSPETIKELAGELREYSYAIAG